MKVAVIINYCSNDYVFLKPCIDAVRPFASEIIVPYCDHFVDGSEENHEVLVKSVAENDGVEFVELPIKTTAVLAHLTNHLILHAFEPVLDEVFELVELALLLGLLVGLFWQG